MLTLLNLFVTPKIFFLLIGLGIVNISLSQDSLPSFMSEELIQPINSKLQFLNAFDSTIENPFHIQNLKQLIAFKKNDTNYLWLQNQMVKNILK